MDISLKKALSILSKSSPYAVSTVREDVSNELHRFKDYLYIETETQRALDAAISQIQSSNIIFVCGSSGDGKSELLTRYKKQLSDEYLFHLDGTHSYSPKETAIHTLDQRFSEFKSSARSLIMGINTGMLANYVADGIDEHGDIKESIQAFLREKSVNQKHLFIDFSNRSISAEGKKSFALKLIKKLTDPVESNPFYQLFLAESNSLTAASILHANYHLLSNSSVQEKIEELLNKVRLQFDQFITARAVLDFVYELLSDKKYLFDALFVESENEILRYMSRFDPSLVHSYELDLFKLQFNLKLVKSDIQSFVDNSLIKWKIDGFNSADSALRFMLLMQSDEDEVKELIVQANQSIVSDYIKIWLMHNTYCGDGNGRQELNNFYRETLVSAIHCYCNRHAQELVKGQYFLYELNGYKVACELDIKPDLSSIADNKSMEASFFYVCFNINGRVVRPIPVNVNLLELLNRINSGYRPNKQDKNAILILDEIVDLVREVGSSINTLYINHAIENLKVTHEDNEYYEVSGL